MNNGLERVTGDDARIVWSFTWSPGVGHAQPYRHEGALIVVYTSDGRMQDGVDAPHPVHRGDVSYFEPGASPNVAHALDDEVTATAVELKAIERPTLQPRAEPPAFPRDGATLIVDNERVAVWRHTYAADYALPFHVHPRSGIRVFLSRGRFQATFNTGFEWKVNATRGGIMSIRAGMIDSEQAIGQRVDAVDVEFKP